MTSSTPQFRIGNGYDIHRLAPKRLLIIGGVKLDHPDGLGLDDYWDLKHTESRKSILLPTALVTLGVTNAISRTFSLFHELPSLL